MEEQISLYPRDGKRMTVEELDRACLAGKQMLAAGMKVTVSVRTRVGGGIRQITIVGRTEPDVAQPAAGYAAGPRSVPGA